MQCPHLFVNHNVKICKRMTEAGTDGKVSDFDVEHYCNSNPVNCYFFRNPNGQTKQQTDKGLKHQIRQIFTTT